MFEIGSVVECRVCGKVSKISTFNGSQKCSICGAEKIQQSDIMISRLTTVEPDTTKIQVVQNDGFSVGGAG